MNDRQKKPKPIGAGNYRICGNCNGYGFTRQVKKYKASPTGDAIVWTKCRPCGTRGWTPAK